MRGVGEAVVVAGGGGPVLGVVVTPETVVVHSRPPRLQLSISVVISLSQTL